MFPAEIVLLLVIIPMFLHLSKTNIYPNKAISAKTRLFPRNIDLQLFRWKCPFLLVSAFTSRRCTTPRRRILGFRRVQRGGEKACHHRRGRQEVSVNELKALLRR